MTVGGRGQGRQQSLNRGLCCGSFPPLMGRSGTSHRNHFPAGSLLSPKSSNAFSPGGLPRIVLWAEPGATMGSMPDPPGA